MRDFLAGLLIIVFTACLLGVLGILLVASASKFTVHKLYLRIRFWFFDNFGVRDSEKLYEGHGNFSEINGWTFRGRFYPCYPDDY